MTAAEFSHLRCGRVYLLSIGTRSRGLFPRLPLDDFKLSIETLDSGRTTLDPISTVHIDQIVEVPDHRMMDVSTNDTIDVMAPGFRGQRFLELTDKIDR